MSNAWRLLITPGANGPWNMAVDEAILEGVERGESPTTLRLYSWQPACLSLGYAQHYADVDENRLQARAWQVVRRATGGRAILHTDELTYSVVASINEQLFAGSLLESYNRLAGALLHAARSMGIMAEMKRGPRVEHIASNPVCFEIPSAYEITVNGKKLIGSAQARRKAGVLQHGSLPLRGNIARITDVLVYTDDQTRETAAIRLLKRATTIESILQREVDWSEAARALRSGFELDLGIRFEALPLSQDEMVRADQLVGMKYGHVSWTKRV